MSALAYRTRRLLLSGLAIVCLTISVSCNPDNRPRGLAPLTLSSSSFPGNTIPSKYSSCAGAPNISPELAWGTPPTGTRSFALLVFDQDSPFGVRFVHWILYNLPSEKRALPEDLSKEEQLPDGSRQGRNGFHQIGFAGPCPPGHGAHRYVFDLYALDRSLDLPPGASRNELLAAIKGHALAAGEFVASFKH